MSENCVRCGKTCDYIGNICKACINRQKQRNEQRELARAYRLVGEHIKSTRGKAIKSHTITISEHIYRKQAGEIYFLYQADSFFDMAEKIERELEADRG
jgi:hypothetical protein